MVAALPITVELRDAIDRVVDQQLDAAGVYADGAEDDGEDDEVEVVAVAVDEDDDVVESEPPRGVLGWTKQLAKGATGVS
ncbi:hypothetical protein, partial [Enterococcus faecalis]|uniref:hypothetical protein n=1 Tax=Enterococcus faecalis TaxID=1351 RepID=UPI003D6B54C5